MEWNIRSDIPAPRPGRRGKYPWPKMDAGDFVDIPWTKRDIESYEEEGKVQRQASAASAARRWVSIYRPDLRVVTESHPEQHMTRIWFDSKE